MHATILLQGRKSFIRIHEDASGGIYCVGVTTRPVNSLEDVSLFSLWLKLQTHKLFSFAFFWGGGWEGIQVQWIVISVKRKFQI